MASLVLQYTTTLLILISLTILLLPQQVICDDEEGNLLSALNSYRKNQGVAPLEKSEKATCLADEIADEIADRACPTNGSVPAGPGLNPGLDNYIDLVKKCGIDINSTQDGVILPVCVPNRVSTLVLTNYTQSVYARYLNSSDYTGFGFGEDDDWTVVVLASNTPGGSFSSSTSLSNALSYKQALVFILLVVFITSYDALVFL